MVSRFLLQVHHIRQSLSQGIPQGISCSRPSGRGKAGEHLSISAAQGWSVRARAAKKPESSARSCEETGHATASLKPPRLETERTPKQPPAVRANRPPQVS